MLLLIDSSVYLSSLFNQEKYHSISVDFFSALKRQESKIILPLNVLYEVLNNTGRLTKANAIDLPAIYQSFADSREFELFYFSAAFNKFFLDNSRRFDLKTADLLIVLSALYHRCLLVSWDKKLLAQAKQDLTAYTPSQFLDSI